MILPQQLPPAKHSLLSIFILLCTLQSNAKSNCTVYGPATNITICANQLPYLWNGNMYNAQGSYTATLAGSAGCDSVVVLNLTVGFFNTSTTNVHICTAQLPYSWNGNSYNVAGTYNVTLISAAGCDSVATLNLTVSPMNSYTNITVCSNMLPYFWNGNAYVVPGTYSVTLMGSSGCDSVASLALYIVDASTSTTQTTVCSTQLPYVWNGNSYNAPGAYVVTLRNAGGCDSSAILLLEIATPIPGYDTATICPAQLPYVWNGHSYTTPGNYSVTIITATNCDSSANLALRSQNNWTGNVNTSWEEPGNWSCNNVPDTYTNVVIESGTVVLHSNTTINAIKLAPAANITVDAGFILKVEEVAPL